MILENNPKMQKELLKMDGVIVPQGWGSRGSEGMIKAIQLIRENKIPYLVFAMVCRWQLLNLQEMWPVNRC
jgi:CTP synthase (UTP-ammonia lyase)